MVRRAHRGKSTCLRCQIETGKSKQSEKMETNQKKRKSRNYKRRKCRKINQGKSRKLWAKGGHIFYSDE